MIDGLASYKKHPPAVSKDYQENYDRIFGEKGTENKAGALSGNTTTRDNRKPETERVADEPQVD